jgi:uncharacterized membrane protein
MSGPAATAGPRPWRLAGKRIFPAPFVIAGISHFASTSFFLKIMPRT